MAYPPVPYPTLIELPVSVDPTLSRLHAPAERNEVEKKGAGRGELSYHSRPPPKPGCTLFSPFRSPLPSHASHSLSTPSPPIRPPLAPIKPSTSFLTQLNEAASSSRPASPTEPLDSHAFAPFKRPARLVRSSEPLPDAVQEDDSAPAPAPQPSMKGGKRKLGALLGEEEGGLACSELGHPPGKKGLNPQTRSTAFADEMTFSTGNDPFSSSAPGTAALSGPGHTLLSASSKPPSADLASSLAPAPKPFPSSSGSSSQGPALVKQTVRPAKRYAEPLSTTYDTCQKQGRTSAGAGSDQGERRRRRLKETSERKRDSKVEEEESPKESDDELMDALDALIG